MRLSVATNFEPDLIEAIKAYPVYELFEKLAARSGRRRSSLLTEIDFILKAENMAIVGRTGFRRRASALWKAIGSA